MTDEELREKTEPREEDRRWFEEHADELLAAHGVGAYVAILNERVLIATRDSAKLLRAMHDAPRMAFGAQLGVAAWPPPALRGRGRKAGA